MPRKGEQEMPSTNGTDRTVDTGADLENPKRQQLIKATMECVAELGVERTTVWMIAERAGVSTGMVLYYYRNKKELISSAVAFAGREFADRLNMLTEGSYGPERLKESIRLILRDPLGAIPANFLIQYRVASLNDDEIRKRSLKQYEQSRESLAKSVRTAQEHGQIRPEVPELGMADLIYTLANGLAAEVAAHPEVMSLERAIAIGQLALEAFSTDRGAATGERRGNDGPFRDGEAPDSGESTADRVHRLLLGDSKLSRPTAEGLAGAFRSLYEIAVRESKLANRG